MIQSGTGLVVGSCEIVECKELTIKDYKTNIDKHNIQEVTTLPYKKTYAWIISNAKKYAEPKKYKHP